MSWETAGHYAFLIPLTVAIVRLGLMFDALRRRETDKRDIDTLGSVLLLIAVAVIILGVPQ